MKPVIRTPYFEVGTKNYVYGDKLLEYARAADAAAGFCRSWSASFRG